MALCAFGLSFSSNKFFSPASYGDALPVFLIVATTCSIYFFSAIRKLRSPDFTSGRSIYTTLLHLYHEKPNRLYADAFYPRWFLTQFVMGPQHIMLKRWKILSLGTIGLEMILPFLLLFPPTFILGVVLGIGMHAAFTFMMPFTLLPFSLVTISTYFLFANPSIVSRMLCYELL